MSVTSSSPQQPQTPPRSDLDWLQAHFEALYRFDDQGRMTMRSAPGQGAPPRFHFARTKLGAIWRFAETLPASAIRELARYAALEPGIDLDAAHVPTPPDRLEPMRRVLEALEPGSSVQSGPAFRLPDTPESRTVLEQAASVAQVATDVGDERLDAWATDLGEPVDVLRSALPLAVSTFEDRVVSSCRVARGDPRRFAEAGLQTQASARKRGHATRCVAAWALAVESIGGRPLYSTEWSNRASRGVAARLGWQVYAESFHFD